MTEAHDPRKLVTDFAREHPDIPALQFINADPEGVGIELFEGGGLVNYVYRVQSRDHSSSVVLKYAEERVRLFQGEKLSLERQTLEYNGLVLMHNIQPGSVPEPYYLDTQYHVVAMQDMSDWQMLGDQLERPNRHVELNAATNLGRLLSKVHRQTTQASVSAEMWQEYQAKFKQVELKQRLCDFLYGRILSRADPITKVADEYVDSYQSYVQHVKACGLDTKMKQLFNHEACFVHTDCHFKSIFVKADRVALFDFEFALLSHPALNLSALISCYMFLPLVDAELTTDPDANPSVSLYRSQCLQACRNLLEAYLEEGVPCGYDNFLADLLLLTGGYTFFLSVFKNIHLIMKLTDETRGSLITAAHHVVRNYANIKTLDDFMRVISA